MARSPYFQNPTYTDFKESVRVASTVSINLALPGASMDGVTLTFGDTILLKDQGIPANNGIYLWAAEDELLERAAGGIDHQISSGMMVIVEEGTVNADKVFMLTTDEPIETGVTELVFEEFSPSGGDADTLEGEAGAFYLDRDNHTGDQLASTISDFDSQVDSHKLNDFAAPDGNVSLGGFKATNLADPVDPQDAATQAYGDANWAGGGGVALGDDNVWTGANSFHPTFGNEFEIRADNQGGGGNPLIRASSGTADYTVVLRNSGQLEWGDGIVTPDTFLYRYSAGALKTDGVLYVGGSFSVDGQFTRIAGSQPKLFFEDSDAATRPIITSQPAANTFGPSVRMNADGKLQWSSGAADYDTNLYRLSPNVLQTDDSLVVDIDLTVNGNTALGNAPTDTIGMFGATPVVQAGAIAAPATQTGSYVQADVQSIVVAVDAIRVALSSIGITV